MRGVPILVLIFLFLRLAAIRINLPNFAAATGIGRVQDGADGEYVRGAVNRLRWADGGAKSIGLTFEQRMAYVVLPWPFVDFAALINGVADAVKGTALVSLLGVTDLMHAIQQVVGRTYDTAVCAGGRHLLRDQLRTIVAGPSC